MQLTVSLSELEISPHAIRRLDLYFSAFEEIASADPNRSVQRLELCDGSDVRADLDPAFPVLRWTESAPARDGGAAHGCRVWRPPLDELSAPDYRWVDRFDLAAGRRSPPVPVRYEADRGWCNPDGCDVGRLCAVLDEVARRLAADRNRAA